MAKKNKTDKLIIPNRPGPDRKHYCPWHHIPMTPVKQFGKKRTTFQCKEGCRGGRSFTDLK